MGKYLLVVRSGVPGREGGKRMSNQQMFAEIICILRRNYTEEYLHHLLNCAIAYEKALNISEWT